MSNKMKKKQVQNQAQQGRSMVEMLGVLAVIGVISIGGIAGYRMAMNRYQANQIANEINLMRTDAKMKVARGVRGELLLGEPYDGDDGHLNFNANYGVAVKFEEIGTDTPGETETGYSFTLSNIPEGVCKPLVTLLDNMDDTADIKIDDKSYYDENASEDFCGETNEVMVAFSTKDIGGVSSGSSNPEPPEEQGDEPQECDPSDPSTCEGECTESGCEPCSGDTPYWNGNVCVGCAGGTWDNEAKTCTCSGSGQTWNVATGECACSSENQHWDASSSRCVACESNEVWNEVDKKCEVPESYCRTNTDCNKEGKKGYFCYTNTGKDGYIEFEDGGRYNSGTCKLVSSYLEKKAKIGGTTYYGTTRGMTWWSACRICAARKGEDDGICKSGTTGTTGTTAEPSFMAGYEMLQCADKIDVDKGWTEGYCHERAAGNTKRDDNNISERVKDLREMYGCNRNNTSCSYSSWLRDSYNSRGAYEFHIGYSRVQNRDRDSNVSSNGALCQ